MPPLFEIYPSLRDRTPHISLGVFPTPAEEAQELAAELGIGRFYIKRDDVSGPIYGGNKVRKLEFLLAEALDHGAKEVMTFGCAGSNHATATAVYSSVQGLRSVNMLLPQPNARSVRRNLLLSFKFGAELHYYETPRQVAFGRKYQRLAHRLRTGREPYVIPAGGSSALGALGFVNAAFELRHQIDAGLMPEPDFIYVPGGTVGTSAGLMVGLRAAGLKTRVVVVRVTGEKFAGIQRILRLLEETTGLLKSRAPEFPAMEFRADDVQLRHDFYGGQYALYTPESVDAVRRFGKYGIGLEGTYTGKTAAALLYDARQGRLKDTVVILWNTYNSRDVSNLIDGIDYKNLPRAFHRYFEQEVQPLDEKEA